MEYFEWYGIEPALLIDEKALQQGYYTYSKKYHPDFHASESIDNQGEVMRISVFNTNAFNTLKQFDTRLKYILEQKGYIKEGDKYTFPPYFLMDMMDVNEQIAEAVLSGDATAIQKCEEDILKLEEQFKAALTIVLDKNAVKDLTEADYAQLLEYHYKHRYILRLQQQLRQEKEL